jgi:phosphatidylserine decarboxylase
MKIHREGYPTLSLVSSVLILLNIILFYFVFEAFIFRAICIFASLLIFTFFLQFFRRPVRISKTTENQLLCPADGEVVVIEETEEPEYFKDKRLQVSIFMSPFNVHANWYPINGKVKYVKYHPGKFLVAWHPKSSTDNERATVVVEDANGTEILIRQIAGAVARRIVTYSKPEGIADKNEELGFIKFGSRVDVFLPVGTKVNVNLKDKVTGNKTILAEFRN